MGLEESELKPYKELPNDLLNLKRIGKPQPELVHTRSCSVWSDLKQETLVFLQVVLVFVAPYRLCTLVY